MNTGVTHVVKILPQHWKRVFDGTKTFEIRVNDRGYQKGDKIRMRPFDPETKEYMSDVETGSPLKGGECCELRRTIGDVYPVDANRVVFSLLKDDGR